MRITLGAWMPVAAHPSRRKKEMPGWMKTNEELLLLDCLLYAFLHFFGGVFHGVGCLVHRLTGLFCSVVEGVPSLFGFGFFFATDGSETERSAGEDRNKEVLEIGFHMRLQCAAGGLRPNACPCAS